MPHLCTHSYTILRIGEGFWWREKLKVNFKKNTHTDNGTSNAFVYILPWSIKKKNKSSVVGRSFTKKGTWRFPEARHLACLPAAKPAERGWRHSTQGFQCHHPLSQGPTPVGCPPHPVLFSLAQARTVSSSGWGRCWEQKGLGWRGSSPAPPFPSQAGPARQSAVSWGLLGPVPPLCLLPDGGTGAQGRWSTPRQTQSESLGMSAKPLRLHPQGWQPQSLLDLILISA